MTVDNDIRSAWQADDNGAVRVSAVDLRSRIDGVSRKASRRTIGGLVVCALVLVSWGYVWWLAPVASGLARGGILIVCVGLAVIAFDLLTHRDVGETAWRAMAQRGDSPSIVFHRWQLERQRDFHRGWRLWNRLLLLTIGGAMFFVGFAGEHPEVARTLHLLLVAHVLLAAAAIPVNARLARQYQAQLDELDNLRKDRP